MEKYELLPEQLIYEGTITESQLFAPQVISDDEFGLTHTDQYLYKLNHQTLTEKEIRNIGFPMSTAFVDRGKVIASGTWQCAKYALEYGIAMNIAGGTHHSFADRGEAFCCFNDVAVASNLLLYHQLASQILIIDLDVHQGNGTAKIFEHDDRVFTFSMHGERNYPTRKERSSLDIGLPDKTDDSSYLHILKETLPRLIDEVKPTFAFYISGVDVLASDRLGRLSLTKAGCKARDKYVFSTLKANAIPVSVSMGGGYSHLLADIIDAHANTYRVASEVYF